MNDSKIENFSKNTAANCEEQVAEFVEPKLSYLKPELQKQGSLENLTKAGFFGLFPSLGS